MTFALRLAGPSAQVGLDRHGSRTLSKCGSSGYDLRTFQGCCRTHDHSADVGVLLFAGGRDFVGMPAGRHAGQAPRATAGGGGNDCRRDAGALVVRLAGARRAGGPVPQADHGRAVCVRAVRRGPVHVPGRNRFPRRPLSRALSQRHERVDGGHRGAVPAGVRHVPVADQRGWPVFGKGQADRSVVVPGRGDRDHRLSDAGAHHPRTRSDQ